MNTIEDLLTINHKKQMKKNYINQCKKNEEKPFLELFEKFAQATLGY